MTIPDNKREREQEPPCGPSTPTAPASWRCGVLCRPNCTAH